MLDRHRRNRIPQCPAMRSYLNSPFHCGASQSPNTILYPLCAALVSTDTSALETSLPVLVRFIQEPKDFTIPEWLLQVFIGNCEAQTKISLRLRAAVRKRLEEAVEKTCTFAMAGFTLTPTTAEMVFRYGSVFS